MALTLDIYVMEINAPFMALSLHVLERAHMPMIRENISNKGTCANALFWIMKIAAQTLGETEEDFIDATQCLCGKIL